jgi:hypothetical protein
MLGFSNSQALKAHPEIADCESLHKVHKLAGGQVTCASNNHHCSLACWLQTCDCLMEALGFAALSVTLKKSPHFCF